VNAPGERPVRVVALTGGLDDPPARFRVRQHVANLGSAGISVREYVPALPRSVGAPHLPAGFRLAWVPPAYAAWQGAKLAARIPGIIASRRGDVTWLVRGLLAGWPSIERLLKRPIVFDVDDAIWLLSPFGRAATIAAARRADVVIVGNAYLADWFRPFAREVRVIPTAVAVRPDRKGQPDQHRGTLTLGWIGTSWSSNYLSSITPALGRFLAGNDAELLVMADRPPALPGLPPGKVAFRTWRPSAEESFFSEVDIGLMPLVEDEWAQGKCAFKMLQFMAAGIPVVVSPIGANREVLALGEVGLAATDGAEWCGALATLSRDTALRACLGNNGRTVVERHFSVAAISAHLAATLRAVARARE